MKQIELIEIRALSDKKKHLDEHIEYFYRKFKNEHLSPYVSIFKSINITTDYMILISSSIESDTQGNVLARRLVDALKDFGSINHATWKEI